MRIVVVCDGNTCRSPMAAAFVARGGARRGLDLACASAGLAATPGAPATPGAAAALAARGLDLGLHRARSLDAAVLAEADVVWAMTRTQVEAIRRRWPACPAPQLLTAAAGTDGDIADPFGDPAADYGLLAARLEALTDAALARLAATRPPP